MSVTELHIDRLGPQGDGVHEDRRGRVFVERTAPGDRVEAHVYRDDAGIARAEIICLITPSPHRQAPPCPHYDLCGNCTLQHVNEAFYRDWKVGIVRDAFRRQGVHPLQWREPVFLGGANRRRATFAARKKKGAVVLGYYQRRSREITAIESCLIASPLLLALRRQLAPLLIPILTEDRICDVFVQLVGEKADLVFTGPVGARGWPEESLRLAVERLLDETAIARVGWRASYEDKIEILLEKSAIPARFGPLTVELPPAAFLQPTAEGETALVGAAVAALPAGGTFADLFSGCGTFTGPLLARGEVDAYEAVGPAVQAVQASAGGRNLRAFGRDLFRRPLTTDEINRYDAVVFDPPRAGCAEQAAEMSAARTPVLVGISCNPATFARDARILNQGGYRLQSVQVVDQFLWSHHVEVVGVFTPKKKGKR